MRRKIIAVVSFLLLTACGSHLERRVFANQGMAPPPPPILAMPPPPPTTTAAQRWALTSEEQERYARLAQNPVQSTKEQRFSTFSVDVDTASYANVRRFLNLGKHPPEDAVRVEELVNYFRYNLRKPSKPDQPFGITADAMVTPWNVKTRLLRIGLRAYDVDRASRPPANLVFLIDTSGSMDDPDKLPLVKQVLRLLTNELRPDDRVSIVTYSNQVDLVLPPTSDTTRILAALDPLRANGATAGGAALKLAYATARSTWTEGGINRIILATDGDFNVGINDPEALKEYVARERRDGVTLTTLGFGRGNYNDQMMEALADAGNGNYAYIDSLSEARKVLSEQLSSTLVTVAQDVKLQVEFNPEVVSEYRLIGYENRALAAEDFTNDQVDSGDVGAGHQVTALYEVALNSGAGDRLPKGRYGQRKQSVLKAKPATKALALEAAFVEIRYKLPGEAQSRLMRRPIGAAVLRTTGPASGDLAFAASVAAFGQALRGGKYLNGFSYDQIGRLAGDQSDPYREEFLGLVKAAEGAQP